MNKQNIESFVYLYFDKSVSLYTVYIIYLWLFLYFLLLYILYDRLIDW